MRRGRDDENHWIFGDSYTMVRAGVVIDMAGVIK